MKDQDPFIAVDNMAADGLAKQKARASAARQ